MQKELIYATTEYSFQLIKRIDGGRDDGGYRDGGAAENRGAACARGERLSCSEP